MTFFAELCRLLLSQKRSWVKYEIYSYSQAREKLAALLEESKNEEVVIRRRKGDMFSSAPKSPSGRSPFDVPGLRKKINRRKSYRQYANPENEHNQDLI